MSSSDVQICNQAISWLGGDEITSLDDGSVEAQLCKANYEPLRNSVLEDREWTFAIQWFNKTPLADTPVNQARWQFKFLLDPSVLRVVEVVDENDNPVKYVKEGRNLLSNVETMLIRCIVVIEDTTQFSPSFVQAFAARIAADICIPLTESRSLQKDMIALYGNKITDAMTTDGMQGTARRVRERWPHRVR